ncbi:MAG: SIS domain-containing protein [Candidatus Baldrarchaeia archaeon]
MKVLNKFIEELLNQLQENIKKIDKKQVEDVLKILQGAKRVITVGMGRSAVVARNLAIRLLQAGFNVISIREDLIGLIPMIKGEEDVIVAISGSGETEEVITMCKIAKEKGAKVVAITSFSDSTLGKLSDYILCIGGRTRRWKHRGFLEREVEGEREPLSPSGSLFEISSIIVLEGLVTELVYSKQSKGG